MNEWKSTKARRVLKALFKIGWEQVKRVGSHRKLRHPNYQKPYVFHFHDKREISSVGLAIMSKQTGLKPSDL